MAQQLKICHLAYTGTLTAMLINYRIEKMASHVNDHLTASAVHFENTQ